MDIVAIEFFDSANLAKPFQHCVDRCGIVPLDRRCVRVRKIHQWITYLIAGVETFIGWPIKYVSGASGSCKASVVHSEVSIDGSSVEFSGKYASVTVPGQCLRAHTSDLS